MLNLILLLFFEIILLFLAFILTNRDIMAPSVVICLMFILSTSFALMNSQQWGIDYSFESFAIITTGIFTFIIAETFFRFFFCGQLRGKVILRDQSLETQDIELYKIKPLRLNLLLIISAVLCFWNFIIVLRTTGFSLSGWTTLAFNEYRHIGVTMLSESGQYVTSGLFGQLIKITTAAGYVASYLLVNQIVYKQRKIGEQIKMITIIIFAVFPSIMSGGRTSILMVLSAIVIEYYIAWHQKNGWHRNLSWKYFRYGIIGLVILIPLFYYSLTFLGRTTSQNILDYTSHYLGSSIQLFDLYIKAPLRRKIIGEESLFSVIKVLHFLGLTEGSTSYNLEFRTSNNLRSNVYTFFRRPLHDFGLFGMYVFVILIAFFFAWMYFKKIKNKKRKKCELSVLAYGYVYYWIIVSSIDQYSVAYISVATIIYIVLTWLLFRWVTVNKN